MRILGMRGIWNPMYGGHSFVGDLLKKLSRHYGYDTLLVRYPWSWALATGYSEHGKRYRAQQLLNTYHPGDVVVAFSMGVLLTIHAMRNGGRFGPVFFFGGSAESDVEFPAAAYQHIYNVYSPSDILLMGGALLPFHEFGDLGIVGYDGTNPNITNIKAPPNTNHGDYSNPHNVQVFAEMIHFYLGYLARMSKLPSDSGV